jgi:CubicO group peptidase (beta-lactamase class C family)
LGRLHRSLTDKLDMKVTFTVEELAAATDAAVPYGMMGDTCQRTKLWPISVPAAGGMSTSITSFANWLRFHLGQGAFEGQRLLSSSLIQELQKPRVHVGATGFAEYSDVHYGFGSARTGIAENAWCGTEAASPARMR